MMTHRWQMRHHAEGRRMFVANRGNDGVKCRQHDQAANNRMSVHTPNKEERSGVIL